MTTNNAVGNALSGSTGTGIFVGSNTPTLVTPILGTPTSGNLANCSGYPSSALSGVVSGAHGGTGVANTGQTISLASGASGKVLTSDSSGNATWQAASGGSITIDVDNSGSVSGSTLYLFAANGSGSANAGGTMAFFAASGTEIDLQTSDSDFNVAIGANTFFANGTGGASSSTVVGVSAAYYGQGLVNTSAFGFQALVLTGTGSTNSISNSCFFGSNCGSGPIGSTSDDTFIGYNVGPNYVGGVGANTVVGSQAIGNLSTGTQNVILGFGGGNSYSGAESYNVLINSAGNSGENATIRIADAGAVVPATACYIGGIAGATVSGSGPFGAVIIDENDSQLISVNTGISNTGYVLTSNGSTTLPSWQAVTTIPYVQKSTNLFIGQSTGYGSVTGFYNFAFGSGAGVSLTNGSGNVLIGNATGGSLTGGSPGGTANTILGDVSGNAITTGNFNVIVGNSSGQNYTSSESNNILIGANLPGVAAESFITRIGFGNLGGASSQLGCYIDGIAGVTVTSTAAVLVDTATGQLGTVISSARFKENIEDIGDDSDFIYDLRPVKFTYKQHPDQGIQTGLIAEEVEKIEPRLVCLDREGIACSVSYHELPVLLLNEIKKLRSRISHLEGKL